MKKIIILTMMIALGCSTQKKIEPNTAATSKPQQAVNAIQTPSSTAAVKKLELEQGKITCVKGKESRILEIIKHGNGCKLNYTKYEKVSVASSSKTGTKHCEDTQTKIRGKLEKSGYQCN